MENTIEEVGETLINKYTINCIPFEGERFLGKLYVTDKALYYDAQYDMSKEGIKNQLLNSAKVAGGHALLISKEIVDQWKSKGYMYIPKSEIKEVIKKSSFIKKTITLVLSDDQKVVFDYGMMSVNKLEQDIKQN